MAVKQKKGKADLLRNLGLGIFAVGGGAALSFAGDVRQTAGKLKIKDIEANTIVRPWMQGKRLSSMSPTEVIETYRNMADFFDPSQVDPRLNYTNPFLTPSDTKNMMGRFTDLASESSRLISGAAISSRRGKIAAGVASAGLGIAGAAWLASRRKRSDPAKSGRSSATKKAKSGLSPTERAKKAWRTRKQKYGKRGSKVV